MNETSLHSIEPDGKRAPKVFEPDRVRPSDLFSVLHRAADDAAGQAIARGLTMALQFDPGLRQSRLVSPVSVTLAVKAMVAAMLRMTRKGVVSLHADGSDEQVTVTVASLLDAGAQPVHRLFHSAAERARRIGGRLALEHDDATLTLTMRFSAPLSPMSVLLIEPSWPGQRQTVAQLEEAGFAVDLAGDGEAALRLSSGGCYVAVLADLYLADENTREVFERLRSTCCAAPVFALHRGGAVVAGHALARAGFAGVLESPVTPRALRAALDSVETAELEAVQASEDADEDENSQDRDHGRLVSAKVRTA